MQSEEYNMTRSCIGLHGRSIPDGRAIDPNSYGLVIAREHYLL